MITKGVTSFSNSLTDVSHFARNVEWTEINLKIPFLLLQFYEISLPKYSRNLKPISGLDDRNLLPSLDPPCKTLPLLSTSKVESSHPMSANIIIY